MTAVAVQQWLEKLGYAADRALLHVRGDSLSATHPYALEIKTLLRPDGAVRAQAVFDVEGVRLNEEFRRGSFDRQLAVAAELLA